tara:strand:+ start:82 stop:255 length:174 start_codon:yes stop_codon:yes gene_type:complete
MPIKNIFDLVQPLTREEAIEHYKRKKASGSEPKKSQPKKKENEKNTTRSVGDLPPKT